MSSSNASFIRPISVMSLLADQMESSSLTETKTGDGDETGIPINNSYKYDEDYKITENSNSRTKCNISTSVPSHRHSFTSGCCSLLYNSNDIVMDQDCVVSLEYDLLSPELPSKRKCHSVSSTNYHISRPIPIKICMNSQTDQAIANNENQCRFNRIITQKSLEDQAKFQQVKSNVNNKKQILCQNQRNNVVSSLNRPVIFAHKRSAFIPTRSLTSPHTSSSDYSISPDIDSPTHRPDSVTSSGFHDCSQQSLLIDPNYSPDANQRSGCATIVNSNNKPIDTATIVLPRCHSQPCYEPVSRNNNSHSIIIENGKAFTCQNELNNIRTNSQFHVPLKRRYPSLAHILPSNISDTNRMRNSITPMHFCYKRFTNSADTSPSAYGTSAYSNFKRDGYFFGNSRNYLVSLPRIASSPTPISPQSNPICHKEDSLKESYQTDSTTNHRQRMGSNSSSLSTSTTTDNTTPTVISNTNSIVYQKISSFHETPMSINKENIEDLDDIEMMESGEYALENRSSTKIKLDYHSQSSSTNDMLYNINLSPDKDQLQFWSDPSFIKSCHSVSSCSVSVTSDITTKSYSTNSDDTSNCTNPSNSIGNSNCESSRSESRDPDDPPEIVGDTFVNNVSSIGFCFRQLTNHSDLMNYNDNSSFQEQLDVDQIELD